MSRKRRSEAKAVFLDRDGTINREVGNIRYLKQIRLLPGVPEAIRALNREGYLVIIITNQPVVARGWITEKELETFHEHLLARLMRKGAHVDAIYYCPHHPEANLKKYRMKCACRKPKSGMIRQGMRDFKINPKKSFMVGDHEWDIMAGRAAGLTTIKVHMSNRSNDMRYAHVKPHFKAKDLKDAVRIIKRHAK